MFGIGLPELVIVLVIVLVLFGAGRISAVMKDLGKGVSSFKEGMQEGKKPLAAPSQPARASRQKTAAATGAKKRASAAKVTSKKTAAPKRRK